jgi:hypothetical membrane protein
MNVAAHADPAIDTAQITTNRTTHFAGFAFFVLAAQFMTVIMAAASMAPGYDLTGGAISDLGIIPTTAPLFNISLIVTGLLNIAGATSLNLAERRTPTLVLAVLAGFGAIGAGVFNLHNPNLHGTFALFAFVFFNLQIIPMALRLHGPMRIIGLVLALIGISYIVVMIIGDGGNPAIFGAIGHGGSERMIAYPPMLWLMAFGGYLMAIPAPEATIESPSIHPHHSHPARHPAGTYRRFEW